MGVGHFGTKTMVSVDKDEVEQAAPGTGTDQEFVRALFHEFHIGYEATLIKLRQSHISTNHFLEWIKANVPLGEPGMPPCKGYRHRDSTISQTPVDCRPRLA